jgi:hypothetical protein
MSWAGFDDDEDAGDTSEDVPDLIPQWPVGDDDSSDDEDHWLLRPCYDPPTDNDKVNNTVAQAPPDPNSSSTPYPFHARAVTTDTATANDPSPPKNIPENDEHTATADDTKNWFCYYLNLTDIIQDKTSSEDSFDDPFEALQENDPLGLWELPPHCLKPIDDDIGHTEDTSSLTVHADDDNDDDDNNNNPFAALEETNPISLDPHADIIDDTPQDSWLVGW